MKNQVEYYQKRALEYEAIYHKPERQNDLTALKRLLEPLFSIQDIIEIACGTGYWTEVIAKKSNSILATDINTSVLEIAKQKEFLNNNVVFQCQDLNDLKRPTPLFDGLFGGFIWSHIPRQELPGFIQLCLRQIKPGGQLVFIDNKYVAGSSTPISRKDGFGNTFQKRKLKNVEAFEIIKNFPDRKEIEKLMDVSFEWLELEYYWILRFTKL